MKAKLRISRARPQADVELSGDKKITVAVKDLLVELSVEEGPGPSCYCSEGELKISVKSHPRIYSRQRRGETCVGGAK